jgi:phosphoglycerate kinase
MRLRTVRDIKKLRDKRVLVRIDANVPIADGEPSDDFRLRAALPTIEYLSGRGAVVIIAAHLGRPKGRDPKLTLLPIARRLAKMTSKLVSFIPDIDKAEDALESAVPGQIFMLENLRFDRGEESNGGSFAKKLARLADAFVNDGFSVSHRAHASVVAVTRYLPAYAGFLMERELKILGHVMQKPARPAVAMMGGAKIDTKAGLIKELAKRFDYVLLGGGLVNPILAAKGFGLGASLSSPSAEKIAKPLLKLKNIVIPSDVLVGQDKKPSAPARLVPIDEDLPIVICRKPQGIVDIGPRTMLAWSGIVKKAKTIVWNGPLGIYETPRFSHGTVALARLVASRGKGRTLAVVGGGETIAALDRTGMAKWVDHVSTGGGAMLEFLEGKTLPGVKPLYGKAAKH